VAAKSSDRQDLDVWRRNVIVEERIKLNFSNHWGLQRSAASGDETNRWGLRPFVYRERTKQKGKGGKKID